jgi:Flp pilus assembly pilin Flp
MVSKKEEGAVTERVLRGYLLAQGAYGTLLRRTHSERGVSTVQYAFLVALVALVVALLVGAFGTGLKGLFGVTHTCASSAATTACTAGSP